MIDCTGCQHGEAFKDSDLSHPLCKTCEKASNYNWHPVFRKGQKAKTMAGECITIVEERRDSDHRYDHVLGSDGHWRYDRPRDCGRVTGQRDPNCPHNLVYGAMGS